MRVSRVVFGDGGEPGVQGEPVRGGAVEQGRCLLVRGAVVQGEPVPELPEPGFLDKGYHLVPASLVGPAAVGVFAAQDAGRGFQEAGEGHGVFVWPRVRSLHFVYWNWVTISYLSAQ